MKLVETCQQITQKTNNNKDRSFLFFKLYDNYIFKESSEVFLFFFLSSCVCVMFEIIFYWNKDKNFYWKKNLKRKGNRYGKKKKTHTQQHLLIKHLLVIFLSSKPLREPHLYINRENGGKKNPSIIDREIFKFVKHTHTHTHTEQIELEN